MTSFNFSKNNNLLDETKNIKLSINKETNIYLFESENTYCIISTIQPVKKYISNIKLRNKTNIILKEILNNINFTYKLLVKNFTYDNTEQLNYKINLLKFDIEKKKSIENDMKYGKAEEYKILKKINNYFKNDLIIMSENKYSLFDFIGLISHNIYELKSNNDKFNDYKTAIIGSNKVLDLPQVFLFQFKNDNGTGNDLYHFIKPVDFKDRYNKRSIFLKMRNIYNEIYDIPRTHLIKINYGETFDLPLNNISNEKFEKIRILDKINALRNDY